ncbi:MAG TPA: hypothetical protein VJN32_00215 [Dehalococcoidia bacterium]|nr:hypothetical protein [Dehalococcoidia bacterium]
MPTLNGACPGCGQTLTLEVTVRTAPRGFTSDSKQVQLVGDREPGQGGTPSTIPPVNTPPPPTPVRPVAGRPAPCCPACGLDGARLEQTSKKSGRPFTAWKCINSECDQNDEIIPNTFRWGKAAA